jgi:hypothetical protein
MSTGDFLFILVFAIFCGLVVWARLWASRMQRRISEKQLKIATWSCPYCNQRFTDKTSFCEFTNDYPKFGDCQPYIGTTCTECERTVIFDESGADCLRDVDPSILQAINDDSTRKTE